MYLKNLTVLGFKSFADKTALNFGPGVTAIVGPNGCGKSNVSDAIRWVLGEQSAKALRGGEMADVIFNGTDGRKPMGMAEVSLTIGDVDSDLLQASGVPVEFNEVTLTRRVFRDGGSEYFLNKTSCRLRDIQQLFAGTGVGKTSYSVMAQGNITQLLSSKPDDRRLVFEEAAGITRFKQQKKEALRKLESTDQNLLRVQDLIREVKRQIGSLQRQAGKARRFKAIQAELQQLDTQLARHQFDVLQEEIQLRQTAADKARIEMDVCQESVIRLEDEILLLRQQLSELEARISLNQQHGLELKAESERNESRIQFNEERIRELVSQHDRGVADQSQSQERLRVAEAELLLVEGRLEQSQIQMGILRTNLEEKRVELSEVEQELSQKHEALRQAQSLAFSTTQQLNRARSEINQLDVQKQGNVVRLEKLQSEKLSLEEEQLRLEMRLAEFTAAVEGERQQVQLSRMTLEERQQRLRAIQGEMLHAQQALDVVVRQQAEKRSRLQVLEQLDHSYEGFGSGALAALKQSQGVLGSLADKIRVPDQHVAAIEAALGHHLQLILTQQPGTATQILSDLSANRRGRASIAALDLGLERGAHAPVDLIGSAVSATPAMSVLTCDDSVRLLVEGMLGRVLIVPDLATATTLYHETLGQYEFVTPSGDLLTSAGVYTGGAASTSGKAPASILGRKNQIAELQTDMARLTEQVEEASRAKGALQSEQTTLQTSLEQARMELRQQEVAVATRQGEFNALQMSRRSLTVKSEQVSRELDQLSAQERAGSEKYLSLQNAVTELQDRELVALSQVGELSTGLDELRARRDVSNARVGESKIALATEEQLLASHGRQRGPLEQRIRELGASIARLQSELSTFGERKANLEAGIAESRRIMERLAGDRETLSQQIAHQLEEKKFQEGEIGAREDQLRGHRNRLHDLQQRRGQLEVELAQRTMSVQNLRERIQSKYQLILEDIRSEGIRVTFADEGQIKIEVISLQEMETAGIATDWETIAQQVASMQKRLDEMGPVNLVAIEEYEETEQRHGFLTTQHDDLIKAKEQLVEVINKINAETKSMFLQTFEQIRANFQQMFVEVFGGGKADLRLTDEGDVLESGIEIVARPPGKQLQGISLLSGGEQTMTAVALLFSIYQVKPSPFCVLDELDAPLDESNINRFVKVLKRFIEQSQFIIITHNKRTIGMADVLYGVTMQEHGVSKIVSVKFNREDTPAPRPIAAAGFASPVDPAGEQEVVLAK